MGKIDFSGMDMISVMIHAIVPQLIEWEKQGHTLEEFLEAYDKGVVLTKEQLK